MTLDFFLKNYLNDEATIKYVEIKNHKMLIKLELVAYLELIANGYRPELDMKQETSFIFAVTNDYDVIFNDDIKIEVIKENKWKVNEIYVDINLNSDIIVK